MAAAIDANPKTKNNKLNKKWSCPKETKIKLRKVDENGNPKLFKKFPNIQTWINDIKDVSYGYVGASSAPFMRYCEDTLKISLDDIKKAKKKIEKKVKKYLEKRKIRFNFAPPKRRR
jgi:hypothetical protein